MFADQPRYQHEELTRKIIGVFFDVYNELGHGFLESVYQEAMDIALKAAGLQVEKELVMQAKFRGRVIGGFKPDLVVSGSVIVELKAVKALDSSHQAQTLNYLRAGVLEVALLLNFGPRPQVRRLAFSNQRKFAPHLTQTRAARNGPVVK
jgi:GxxExxY protein